VDGENLVKGLRNAVGVFGLTLEILELQCMEKIGLKILRNVVRMFLIFKPSWPL
jgi:hypothetical protein